MKVGVSLPVRELREDVVAIRDFAQLAEELGFTHLRIPDQIARPGAGHLHEPLTLLSYLAACTRAIELVPSVLVLPARQTLWLAKLAAGVDLLSAGRLRLGVGVGSSAEEYEALGQDFHRRGRRCSEQMELLRLLWTQESVEFAGEFDQIAGIGINPLPVQRPIPMWIGGSVGVPPNSVLERIGHHADGWFALCEPEELAPITAKIAGFAKAAGREPGSIGVESGVGIAGRSESEWTQIVAARRASGVTHLCMRTLGCEHDAAGHLEALRRIRVVLDEIAPSPQRS